MLRHRVYTGTDFTRGPSPHLSWVELDQRDGQAPYPERWRLNRGATLGFEFELIRLRVGASIRINSGYRSLLYNKAVGSRPKSQHVQGRAIDLAVPKKLSLPDFLDIIIEVARLPYSRLKGIGVYPTFIHIDTRPSERIARWRGSRRVAEALIERVG